MWFLASTYSRLIDSISFGTNALFWLILGIIFSILVSFIARYLYDWYRKPQLNIKGEHTDDHSTGRRTFLIVHNNGRSVANNCTGEILIPIDSSNLLSVSPNDLNEPKRERTSNGSITAKLCWSATEGVYRRSLNIDDNEYLGICQYFEEGISFPSENGWDHPTFVLHPDSERYGEVELNIRVTAENCEPVESTFMMNITSRGVELTREE